MINVLKFIILLICAWCIGTVAAHMDLKYLNYLLGIAVGSALLAAL